MNGPRPTPERKRRRREDADATMTRTEAMVLEPKIRSYAGRRYVGGAVGIFALLVAGAFAVARLASIEQLLSAEGANAKRGIVYELPAASQLHVPLEARTDVVRFVLHAYRRSAQLALTPRKAKVRVHLRGTRGERDEELEVQVPGERTRVTPEDAELAIGDPVTLDVDVSGIGTGELVVELASIEDAGGLLVRAYSREQLSKAEATLRATALDRRRKEELAQSTWEVGWDELTQPERDALLGARWKRLGKLRSAGGDLRSVAVAFSPPPAADKPVHADVLLGRVALRGDERVALLVHEGTAVRAVGDPTVVLRATIRTENADPRTLEGKGQLDLPAADVEPFSVEITSDKDGFVDVRAPSSDGVEWLGYVTAFRATPARPASVFAWDAPRVVRVTVRRPLDRRENGTAKIAARVELNGPGVAKPMQQVFRAERVRSRFERYEAVDPLEAPSERAVFYVALPRDTVANIAPLEGALDVSLAELDENRPPAHLLSRPEPGELPRTQLVGESEEDPFVARRPSHAEADATRILRVPRRLAPREVPPAPGAPNGELPLAHAKHNNLDVVVRGGKPFEGIAKPWELEADERRPLLVPIVATAARPGEILVDVARDPKSRPPAGLYERWTLPRILRVTNANDVHAAFAIGDDVPRGKHSLVLREITKTPAEPTPLAPRVHLPWAVTNRGPRWIAGWFEE